MLAQRQQSNARIDEAAAQEQLNRVLMAAFCRSINSTQLSPIEVMRMMAGALGKAYAEVAAAHQHGDCPCGWQPSPSSDIESLRAALAHALVTPDHELLLMTVAGRA